MYHEDSDIRIDNIESRGIILKDDKVLLIFRIKNGGKYYVFPGGHMREGETPLDTAIREIEEETTVKAKDLTLIYELKTHIRNEIIEQYCFLGEWESGEPMLSGEEAVRNCEDNYYEPMWVDIDKIKDLNLFPSVAKEWVVYYLKDFLESRK
jgi:8-oxo-dGTP pyrophosphatase MutT (NUDIX family)